jgi:hypothetical protein
VQQLRASGGGIVRVASGVPEDLPGLLLGTGGGGVVIQRIERGARVEEDLLTSLGVASSGIDLIEGLREIPEFANIGPLADLAEGCSEVGPESELIGIASNLLTIRNPDFSGTAGDIEQGVASVDLLAEVGSLAISLTGAL